MNIFFNFKSITCYLLLLFLFVPIQKKNDPPTLNPSDLFSNRIESGKLENVLLTETSGLAFSFTHPDYLWALNDSGNDAEVYLLDNTGKNIGVFPLEGIRNRDWEEMGRVTDNNINYILLGEIGDNDAHHEKVYIYKFPEPTIDSKNKTIAKKDIQSIRFEYADGARDAEAFFADPITKDIYIISKRESKVGVYRLAYPQSVSKTNIAEKVTTIPYTSVTAADISMDGKEILIKTYNRVLYWKRENTAMSISDLLQEEAIALAYTPEPQGESITWDNSLKRYYTISEGVNANIYYYEKK